MSSAVLKFAVPEPSAPWSSASSHARGRKINPLREPLARRCRLGVFRYRSLRDENQSMSAMPRKRRLAVKASSVAMGQELP